MEHAALNDVLVLLLLSVATVALVRRIHLPPILGYLLIGVMAGHHALGWVPDTHAVHLLGEIGVVFLLFMIGLEISIPQLMAMKGIVLGLGGAQVLGSTVSGALIAYWLGIGWEGAVVVGGALALSSTALVVKQLGEQLEMSSRHGRIALGILLFQDLAVVPFLVMIPILAGQGEGNMATALLLAMLKGAVAIGVMVVVGRKLLRPLFHWVSAAHSVELFTLAILLVALAAAWITAEMGLSLALGAFLAGLLLGDTEYRHQIETEIRPFRDVLMGLFFITVGTNLNPNALAEVWPWASLLVVGLILGKGLWIALLTRLGGYDWGVSTRAGVVLGQGGEFGFALLALSLSFGLISEQQSQPILAAIVVSMAIAPLLIKANGDFAKRFCGGYMKAQVAEVREIARATHEVEGHVVICGFGRLGQNLADFLKQEGIEYVAVDLDPVIIREAYEAGERVFYGDSTHRNVLRGAGVRRARALVITFDDHHVAEKIIDAARGLNADMPIIVRAHDDLYMEELEAAGATIVVPETVEASLTMAGQLMRMMGVAEDEIRELIHRSRDEHYKRLRGYFHGDDLDDLAHLEGPDRYRLHTVPISEQSYAADKSLDDLAMPETCEVTVHAVRRGDVLGEEPDGNFVLRAGDALILQGPPESLERAERRLLRGAP
ncbi:MAG: monovalent cation:proton antiporter-2 (CPA2) family protein, partial [Gammaproteobacteria bacterium]